MVQPVVELVYTQFKINNFLTTIAAYSAKEEPCTDFEVEVCSVAYFVYTEPHHLLLISNT